MKTKLDLHMEEWKVEWDNVEEGLYQAEDEWITQCEDASKEYLKEIGKYDVYEAELTNAIDRVYEETRCDYNGCENSASTSAENYSGEYCYAHKYRLEKYGKSKARTKTYSYEDAEDYYYEAWDE